MWIVLVVGMEAGGRGEVGKRDREESVGKARGECRCKLGLVPAHPGP
jgi:hypothetical protein